MTQVHASNEAAIREQAYLLWEREGRPAGRDMEFWTRAQVALAEDEQMQHLTQPVPKRAKAAGRVASAAGVAKTPSAKTKAEKADGKGRPKKK